MSSAIDNPQNFFAAKALNDRASDLERLLDNMGQSTNVINTALNGLDKARDLLNLQLAYLDGIKTSPLLGTETRIAGTPLNELIQAQGPDLYWRLNEIAGTSAEGGPVDGTYENGVTLGATPLYENGGDFSASFNGINQYISVPNSPLINVGGRPERTIELVFNANTTAGRQVLWEEGGNTNGMTLYIDNGSIYFNARSGGSWGPFNISAPINAGETYHIAAVIDQPNGEFRGYLNGALVDTGLVTNNWGSHTNRVGIGAMSQNGWFHDGPANVGTGFFFNGRISDVALYNDALDGPIIEQHASSLTETTTTNGLEDDYNLILEQLDLLIADSHYRGINLLNNGTLTTFLNEKGSSFLTTEGDNFTSRGLDLRGRTFNSLEDITEAEESIRKALKKIERYERTFATDFSVLENRNIFTNAMINTLEDGADKLVLADLQEEAAKLLALQTRQQIQFANLSFVNQQSRNILDVFFGR